MSVKHLKKLGVKHTLCGILIDFDNDIDRRVPYTIFSKFDKQSKMYKQSLDVTCEKCLHIYDVTRIIRELNDER